MKFATVPTDEGQLYGTVIEGGFVALSGDFPEWPTLRKVIAADGLDALAKDAEALWQAEQTGQQIGLLSLKYAGMTMDDAYAVQATLIARRKAVGREVTGWKIGLTSKVMQSALNIDIPDSGVLMDDMVFVNGGVVPKGRFIQPWIEAPSGAVIEANFGPFGGVLIAYA